MYKEIDIKLLVENLNWNFPEDIQNNAIAELCTIEEKYLHLIFDKTQKDTWKNSVEIIEKIGYPKNSVLLPQLIWILKDVNWPGALKSIEILSALDKKKVIPLVESGILQAHEECDYMWLGGLHLLTKTAGYNITDFSNAEIFKILEKADF